MSDSVALKMPPAEGGSDYRGRGLSATAVDAGAFEAVKHGDVARIRRSDGVVAVTGALENDENIVVVWEWSIIDAVKSGFDTRVGGVVARLLGTNRTFHDGKRIVFAIWVGVFFTEIITIEATPSVGIATHGCTPSDVGNCVYTIVGGAR